MAEWKSTVTVEATEPMSGWSLEVLKCKAMRAYACDKKLRLQDVSVAQVEKSKLGLKGYADLYEKLPGAQPKPGPDGTNNTPPPPAPVQNKRRRGETNAEQMAREALPPPPEENSGERNTKRGKRDQTQAKKEKEVKELLAMEQPADKAMSLICKEVQQDGPWWAWAKDAIQSYKQNRITIMQAYTDQAAFQQMKVAALSPKETQKLKKDLGEHYVSKLVEYTTVLGPLIQTMAEGAFQIQHMASAKRQAADELKKSTAPKAKAKRKAAAKAKRASSKSFSEN